MDSLLLKFVLLCNPANIYLLKLNTRNTRKRCEICSKAHSLVPDFEQVNAYCVGLMIGYTGGLVNEAYLSNSMIPSIY